MSPLPPRRAHDIGFSDAVSDVVDIVKHETSRRGRARGNFKNAYFGHSGLNFTVLFIYLS